MPHEGKWHEKQLCAVLNEQPRCYIWTGVVSKLVLLCDTAYLCVALLQIVPFIRILNVRISKRLGTGDM